MMKTCILVRARTAQLRVLQLRGEGGDNGRRFLPSKRKNGFPHLPHCAPLRLCRPGTPLRFYTCPPLFRSDRRLLGSRSRAPARRARADRFAGNNGEIDMTVYTHTARFDTGRTLTEDELRKAAPSIFATAAQPSATSPLPAADHPISIISSSATKSGSAPIWRGRKNGSIPAGMSTNTRAMRLGVW